jgi:uncharacterized phage infection (PIP) family protein YhgE
MNAYELADWLENWTEGKPYPKQNPLIIAMLRQQQDEIDLLKKYIAESNALDKKLHESIQKANEVWGNATKSILKKAKK